MKFAHGIRFLSFFLSLGLNAQFIDWNTQIRNRPLWVINPGALDTVAMGGTLPTWVAIANCSGDGQHALTYSTATHSFSCTAVQALPTGGETGDVLEKISNANYDVGWRNTVGTGSVVRAISPTITGMTHLGTAYFNGIVGIGTNSPANSLHIKKDQAASTLAIIENKQAVGANVAAGLQFLTATTNSYANSQLVDDATTNAPYFQIAGGSGVKIAYQDFNAFSWRSAAGVPWMNLSSQELTTTVNHRTYNTFPSTVYQSTVGAIDSGGTWRWIQNGSGNNFGLQMNTHPTNIFQTAISPITVANNGNVQFSNKIITGAEGVQFGDGTIQTTAAYNTVIDVTKPPYSADPTGVADATAALNNALAQCPGKKIFIPAGEYKINGTLIMDGHYPTNDVYHSGCTIEGAGGGVTRIHQTGGGSPHGLIITNSFYANVSGILFYNDIWQAGTGYALAAANTAWTIVRDIKIDHYPNGIYLSNAGQAKLELLDIRNYARNTGNGIYITGTILAGAADVFINRFIIDGWCATATCGAGNEWAGNGILIDNVNGLHFTNGDVVRNIYNLTIAPTNGSTQIVEWVFITDCAFDSAKEANMVIAPNMPGSGTVFVRGIFASNSWFSGAGNSGVATAVGDGIRILPATGAYVTGFSCVGCQIYGNSRHGINLVGGYGSILDTTITGSWIGGNGLYNAGPSGGAADFRYGNGSDIYVGAGQTNFSITGNHIGPGNSIGDVREAEKRGIEIASGASSVYTIANNNFTLNGLGHGINTSGAAGINVTKLSGPDFDNRMIGVTVYIDGYKTKVASVTDASHLVLTAGIGVIASATMYSYYDIEDNGTGMSKVIGPNVVLWTGTKTFYVTTSTIDLPPSMDDSYHIFNSSNIDTITGGYNGRTIKLIFLGSPPGNFTTAGNIAKSLNISQNQMVACTFSTALNKWFCQ